MWAFIWIGVQIYAHVRLVPYLLMHGVPRAGASRTAARAHVAAAGRVHRPADFAALAVKRAWFMAAVISICAAPRCGQLCRVVDGRAQSFSTSGRRRGSCFTSAPCATSRARPPSPAPPRSLSPWTGIWRSSRRRCLRHWSSLRLCAAWPRSSRWACGSGGPCQPFGSGACWRTCRRWRLGFCRYSLMHICIVPVLTSTCLYCAGGCGRAAAASSRREARCGRWRGGGGTAALSRLHASLRARRRRASHDAQVWPRHARGDVCRGVAADEREA